MKLATFRRGPGPHDQGRNELGAVIEGERIVPLGALARDMIDLIARWGAIGDEARRLAGAAAETLPLSDVHLLAPIPRPGKIMAIGLNYADHIAETGAATPAHQIWFSKGINAVTGPFDPVDIPRVSRFVDYEAELVTIVGARGRHFTRDAAPAAVFGFCVGNDVSERFWQNRTAQWVLGKSFDTHAPFGPWITTADEVGDPHVLGIRGIVNGETRQDSNTRHLVFNVWDQLAELSQVMTLEPGDVIYTGTPGGVGAAMKPPRPLKAGDKVRIEIDRLGAIENTFVAEG
ncbi:MAG: 5-carboxymethyl-2-hydroxymuconate isomerase [Caulobacteraceae bacterium]|nr:5-carboxymethyl-2-hydroxymuconate isomerase [Caulobacteraceae bacterium]